MFALFVCLRNRQAGIAEKLPLVRCECSWNEQLMAWMHACSLSSSCFNCTHTSITAVFQLHLLFRCSDKRIPQTVSLAAAGVVVIRMLKQLRRHDMTSATHVLSCSL